MANHARVLFQYRTATANTAHWSGDGNHFIVRSMPLKRAEELGIPKTWHYAWDDGWSANVSARVMDRGERVPKSDGFCGYDWMVANIIRWGTPYCQHQWETDPNSGKPGWEGQWERCVHCRSGRRVQETAEASKGNPDA